MYTFQLGKKSHSVERYRLRKWLELEAQNTQLHTASKRRDVDGLCRAIYSLLFFATGEEADQGLPWFDVVDAYVTIRNANAPKFDFPLLSTKIAQEKSAWDYEGRMWYLWAHTLSDAYGWNLEYIAQLDVDDAIALSQEILVDKQLMREWEWGLSERAFSYNPKTNISKFNELPRPDFMIEPVLEPKKTKMKRSMMPVGNVIKLDDIYKAPAQ